MIDDLDNPNDNALIKIAKYLICSTIATSPLWGIVLLAYLIDWLFW